MLMRVKSLEECNDPDMRKSAIWDRIKKFVGKSIDINPAHFRRWDDGTHWIYCHEENLTSLFESDGSPHMEALEKSWLTPTLDCISFFEEL